MEDIFNYSEYHDMYMYANWCWIDFKTSLNLSSLPNLQKYSDSILCLLSDSLVSLEKKF